MLDHFYVIGKLLTTGNKDPSKHFMSPHEEAGWSCEFSQLKHYTAGYKSAVSWGI